MDRETFLNRGSGFPLEKVISKNELSKRKSKPVNYKAEAEALHELAEFMALPPEQILQKLVDMAMRLCNSQSAGISVVEPAEEIFSWKAVAGELKKFGVAPVSICEVLQVPVLQQEKIVGAIWVVFHSQNEHFDQEDLRILSSLSHFAGSALRASQQRKDLEEAYVAVEASHDQLRGFFMQAPMPLVILEGSEHLYTLSNPPYEKMVGRKVLGRKVLEAFTKEEVGDFVLKLDQVYNTGVPFIGQELPLSIPDEKGVIQTRYLQVGYYPFRNPKNEIIGLFAIHYDLTEQVMARKELQKAKEDAELANSLKSTFLANMSHEIRTPLGAMIGFADLLRDLGLSEKDRSQYLETLIRNGQNLNVIINDILDLSKVEAGFLYFEFSDVSPAKVIEDVVSLLSLKAKEKKISLKTVLDSSLPPYFVTDPMRLKQILLNLIGNSLKFTENGFVQIKAFIENAFPQNPVVFFEITDTGIGFEESQKEDIFEVFVQGNDSMVRKFGGTGLGLSLSRRLARELGGDITVKSSVPGKGSVFLVEIKHQPERKNAVREKENFNGEAKELKDPNLDGVRVLVVDDAIDNRELIGHYLKRRGAILDSAENGELAFEKALHGDYDVVLMDLQMPVMDGLTATHKLRESGYKKPIIALTAHVMRDVQERCLRVGCTDHLPKPINPQQLIQAVAEYTKH